MKSWAYAQYAAFGSQYHGLGVEQAQYQDLGNGPDHKIDQVRGADPCRIHRQLAWMSTLSQTVLSKHKTFETLACSHFKRPFPAVAAGNRENGEYFE